MDYHTPDDLITIVIAVLSGAGIQSEQRSGKESETYPGRNCKRPKIRSGFSICDLAGNNQIFGSSDNIRQISASFLETCFSSSCTVCPIRPVHYTKDAPYTSPECLHLLDWER